VETGLKIPIIKSKRRKMNLMKNITVLMIILVFAVSCKKDEDSLKSLDNVAGPSNVTAIFNIAQDNSGLVTIVPNADGVTKFLVTFGDVADEEPTSYNLNETITHTYTEGVFKVTITAVGITGLTAKYEQDLNVTFKAPENLVVSIVPNASNPRIISISATADFATIIDIYFGDQQNEVPAHALPGEVVTHTYAEPGDYLVVVVAKSGGSATADYSETITIAAASDPVNLPINFESFTVNYAFTDFGNALSSVIDNPDATGINTSSRVAQTQKLAGAEIWAGSLLILENPIDFSTDKVFKLKVWSPKSGAVVKMKVENLNDGNIAAEVDALTTMTGQWEELSYDFSGINIDNEYQKVVVFFDFGNPGDDAIYYFDDIKLVPATIPSTLMIQDFEGEAPVFTSFGNIAAIEVISNPDPSGANTTATAAKLTKTSGSEIWAGCFFETGTVIDLDNFSKIKVKTWSPKSGIVVKLKLENQDAGIVYEVDVTNATANVWEELIFDYSEAPAADYVRVVIFFDFGNPGDGSVYYFDEIELANDGSSSSVVFQDFEGEVPVFTSFGNIADIEVGANPDPSGVNTTATAAKLTKTDGSEIWAGAFFEAGILDIVNYKKIKVSTWSPKSGIVVKLKLENQDASIVYEVDVTNTTANAWENLVYDFSAAPSADYVRLVIFFDFGNPGDGSAYYFDQFELTN
jgi:hypothetical protein